MSTHNLYFQQKYEKYQRFLSENFQFLEVKFSVYLNRHVFVMFVKPRSNEYQNVFFYGKIRKLQISTNFG